MRRFGPVVVLSVVALLTLASAAHAATDVDYSPSEFGSSFDVDGEDDSDVIAISVAGNTITITDTGVGGITTTDVDCTAVNATTVTCPLDPPGADRAVDFYDVQTQDGTDSVVVETLEADGDIEGDAGNKTFTAGPGDDDLVSRDGDDTLNGGAGDDDLDANSDSFVGTGGTDTIIGGPGHDDAEFFDRELDMSLTLDSTANDGIPGENDQLLEIEDLSSGAGDDVLVGDATGNSLTGGEGNDLVRGRDGHDYVDGGDDDDILDPGNGNDEVFCGDGLDVLLSTPGDFVYMSCERTGATIESESAKVSRKNVAKVKVACPIDEGVPCAGKVVLVSNGKKLSKQGGFTVGAGEAKSAKAKLSKKGVKKLKQSGGSLLVSAEARTEEPGGIALDSDRVQLVR